MFTAPASFNEDHNVKKVTLIIAREYKVHDQNALFLAR